MKRLFGLAMLACLASCNAILGVQDLSQGDGDAGTDGSGGGDGGGEAATVRFLFVVPEIFTIDPSDPSVAIHLVGGPKVADLEYGVASGPIDIPLGVSQLEIRTLNGGTVHATVALSFDRAPVAGDRATVVIAGEFEPTSARFARARGFNEAEFPDPGANATVRYVHAVTDGTDYAFAAEASGSIVDMGELSQDSSVPSGDLPTAGLWLRVGAAIDATVAGTEDFAFNVPGLPSGSKVLFVLAGLQQYDPANGGPALSLFVIPTTGSSTRIRQAPAYFIVNLLTDWAGATLQVMNADNGLALSESSSSRTKPMLVFARDPAAPLNVQVGGISGLMAPLPPVNAGSRIFIALTGYMAPSTTPAAAFVRVDNPTDDDGTLHLSFLQASPDPAQVDVEGRIQASQVNEPVANNLAFGQVAQRAIVPGETYDQIRILPPGASTTPIATFNTVVSGRRQISGLFGVQTGNGLRIMSTSLDRWPWTVQSPVAPQ